MTTEVVVGGVPTDPQVRRLKERYADVQRLRGTTIPHEDVEDLIEVSRHSTRYKTITDRWRRHVELETGVVISGMGEAIGIGFRVLTHGEQVEFAVGQRVSAGRRIQRWHSSVANTDPAQLSAAEVRVRDFEVVAAAKLHLAMTEVRHALPARTTPAEQQPRRHPVGAA